MMRLKPTREEKLENYKKYYRSHKEYFRKYYGLNKEKINQMSNAWRKNHKERANELVKRYKRKNKPKCDAGSAVRRAIKTGELKKEPCFVCGNLKTEAHHSHYNYPLEVLWMCKKCHEDLHRQENIQKEEDLARKNYIPNYTI